MALSIIAEKSFKVKLSAKKWKELFRTFKAMQPKMKKTKKGDFDFDLPITVTPDHIMVKCMDASHITLIVAVLKKEECLSYNCLRETTFTIGLHKLLKVLDTILDNEIVTLEMGNGALSLHTIQALDDDKTLRKSFKIKSEEGKASSPIPKLTLSAKFNIHSHTLGNILRSLASKGEYYFKLEAKGSTLTFSNNEAGIVIPEWDIELKEDSKAAFSIEMIQLLLTHINAKILTIEYGSKLPMKISYPGVDYWIAPRKDDYDEKTPQNQTK